jgi:glycine dehydrogenase subunit 2
VLNANYIRAKLGSHYKPAVDRVCKHECVFSTTEQMADNGVHTLDIAKALIDRGFHPPTVYFPTIVKEAMMIEPTESESKETLDAFVAAMIEIADLAEKAPEELKAAPVTTPVNRPDETAAAKNLNIACI